MKVKTSPYCLLVVDQPPKKQGLTLSNRVAFQTMCILAMWNDKVAVFIDSDDGGLNCTKKHW